jgi:pyruvate ferredoxin oxidoreductase gamma subunit
MSASLKEIRWHGRGGMGVKTATVLVAEAALEEGKYSQGFPEYGPERMGAPVRGFTRISDHLIRMHQPIEQPDVVVVLDETLIGQVDVIGGMKPDSVLIVNTKATPAEVRKRAGLQGGKVYTVDATGIALATLGRNVPNTPMVGALMKATNVLTMQTVRHDTEKKLSKKFPEKIVAGNIQALERGYNEITSES